MQNVLQFWHFYQIFRQYFFLERDISMILLWAQAYNNNTLLLAAIRFKNTMSTAIER